MMRTKFDRIIEEMRARADSTPPLSPDFVKRTMAKLEAAGAFKPAPSACTPRMPRLWRFAVPALAACILVLVGITVVCSTEIGRHSPPPLQSPAGADTRNGATLSDDAETEREPAGQDATWGAGGSSDIEAGNSDLNPIADTNPKDHGAVNERAISSDPSDGLPMDPVGCYYAADPSFIQPDRRQPVPNRANGDIFKTRKGE